MAPAAVAAAFPFRLFSVEAARRSTKGARGKRSSARPVKSPPLPPASSSAAVIGRGATTFTRLPLRDAAPEAAEVTLERFPTAPGDPERRAPALPRGSVRRLGVEEDNDEEEDEEVDFSRRGAVAASRLPLRDAPSTSGRAAIGQFDARAARKSLNGRAISRQIVEQLEDDKEEEEEEEDFVVTLLDIFEGHKGRKSRAILPEELGEDDGAVVFDPDYGVGSDDDEEEFDMAASEQAPPGDAIAHAEIDELEYDGEDDDEAEVVVYQADDDEEEEEEEVGVFEGSVHDDDGEEEVKEKGVPAVMRCFDTARIYSKAGLQAREVRAARWAVGRRRRPRGQRLCGGGRGHELATSVPQVTALPRRAWRARPGVTDGRGQRRGRRGEGAAGNDGPVGRWRH